MPKRNKYIYRDNPTGRLITRREAEGRDPSTFTEEEFSSDSPSGQEQRPRNALERVLSSRS